MGKSMEAWHSTPSEGSVRREAPGCCGKKNGIGVTHHDRVLNYSCTLESRWLASILSISNPLEIYKYVLWITGKVGPIFIQMPFDGKIFEKGSYYGIRWIEIFRFILRKCIQIKLTIKVFFELKEMLQI